MADISDVEEALCGQIFAAVYPNGLTQRSVTNHDIKIYRGWPANKTLNADLAGGKQTVTVFSQQDTTRDTSRYPRVWRTLKKTAPSIVVNVDGDTLTLSGAVTAGQLVGLLVAGVAYSYAMVSGDTLQSTATALAGLVPGAVCRGSTITVPGANDLEGRVAGSGTAEMETRRQEQGIMVSVWCPTPRGRDVLAAAIDTALSQVDWLPFKDGTVGRLLYRSTTESDVSENANLYRRNLDYLIEYPTTVQQTNSQMMFGVGTLSGTGPEVGFSCLVAPPQLVIPPLGAIRFDAWYDPANPIDQQCAVALSAGQFMSRLPSNATIAQGVATWPRANQATIDNEIIAAVQAGLGFWAFDSYGPEDTLSLALQFYLSSSLRSKMKFCMLGQTSNWGAGGQDQPPLFRDISMMTQPGYMTVLGGRPLYLVLDSSSSQLSGLPPGGVATAIAFVRSQVQAAGGLNPYVVWLSSAALTDYSNVSAATAAGADAAAAYATPRLNGAPQPYGNLTQAAALDWKARAAAGFPMIPTAMTGWDQRPLIEDPQPFYPLNASLTTSNYYETAEPVEIGAHVVDMVNFINANGADCPAQIGLIYAWNELAEGGWLMPTYDTGGPDLERVSTVGNALQVAVRASATPSIGLVK